MSHRSYFRALLAVGVTFANVAPAAPPAATPTTPPTPAPSITTADPTPPVIDDPMLVPVPAAQNQLTSFRQALELVRTQTTALKISRAQVEQAQGVKRSAWAAALPTLVANATTRHFLYGNTAAAGQLQGAAARLYASLDLSAPILATASWYAIGTAKERIRAAELDQKDAERLLLANVAQAAVSEVTASRVAESSRVSLGSALSTLDLTKRRAQLGAATAVDVLRADQEVASSRAQVVSADESLRQAREALGASLGDTRPWAVSPGIQLEELARATSVVCTPVDDIERRSDIQAAKKSFEAAQRDRNQVDYTYVPTIDVVSSLGYLGGSQLTQNSQPVTWTAGLVLSWPLFDGGDRYGRARSRQATAEIARQELVQQKRDATIAVRQADRAVVVAETNMQVATAARDINRESARLSKLAFMNGSGTSFDLVDSARRLREAEINLLIRDFGVFKAKIAAFLARANCSI